jgi:hypothetical protein
MGNQQERSLSWLAGILDGEGSISFQVYTLPSGRVRITPFVVVVNSDQGILDETYRIMWDLTESSEDARPRWCSHKKTQTGFASQKKCHAVRIDGRATRLVIEPIKDHLRSHQKRRNAEVVLAYLDSRDAMLLKRDEKGRIERQGYTKEQVELVTSIRTHSKAKSSEAICQAPNVIG